MQTNDIKYTCLLSIGSRLFSLFSSTDWFGVGITLVMRLCNPLHFRQVWRPQAIAWGVHRHNEFETDILHFEALMILNNYFIQCWLDCGSCRKRKMQEHRITEIVMKAEQLNAFLDSLCKVL